LQKFYFNSKVFVSGVVDSFLFLVVYNERQLALHKGGGGGSGSIEIMLNNVTELDGRELTRQTRKWHYDEYGSLT
jgi:hypothetical protein